MKKIYINACLPILVIFILLIIPPPNGLATNAWHFFALFIGVIIGVILEPIPSAAIGFIGVSTAAVFSLVSAPGKVATPADNVVWVLSGFSNTVVWLIFAAFMFSLSYKKTGLGKRIGLTMVKYLGKHTLGLGYALSITNLLLAPCIPSNTARSGGIIYPIAATIPPIFDSSATNNPRKIGSYLMWLGIASDCIVSSMFLTSQAATLLAATILGEFGIHIKWLTWFSTLGLICLPIFLLTPFLIYLIYPPEVKKSQKAVLWATEELKKIGTITKKELTLICLVLIALVLWIFGDKIGVHATTAALFVVSLLIIFRVITWDDLLSNKAGLNILIWFSTLIAMASGLNKVGFLHYISDSSAELLSGLSYNTLILAAVISFVLIHYLFASSTAHVTALLAVYVTTLQASLPPELMYKAGLLLAGSVGLMGILTPYATGPGPIWYGSGFISQKTWWRLGFIFITFFLVIYLSLGMLFL